MSFHWHVFLAAVVFNLLTFALTVKALQLPGFYEGNPLAVLAISKGILFTLFYLSANYFLAFAVIRFFQKKGGNFTSTIAANMALTILSIDLLHDVNLVFGGGF